MVNLDDVESDALDSSMVWIPALKGYFRGLIAAGLIDVCDLEDLEAVLISYGLIK